MKIAFVTLVSSEDFALGAELLLYSLHRHFLKNKTTIYQENSNEKTCNECKYRYRNGSTKNNEEIFLQILVLITPNISEEVRTRLKNLGAIIKEVEVLSSPYECSVKGWKDVGFTKLNIWNLVEYKRVVYVDADCLIVDETFEELIENNLFPDFNLKQRDNKEESCRLSKDGNPLEGSLFFAACPDIFPPDSFNAGVMIIEPNKVIFENLCENLGYLPSYDGGDTGYLNAYFKGWFSSTGAEEIFQLDFPPRQKTLVTAKDKISKMSVIYKRLPFAFNAQRYLYNMTFGKQAGYWNSLQPVKIIHFSSHPKPWDKLLVDSKQPDLSNSSSDDPLVKNMKINVAEDPNGSEVLKQHQQLSGTAVKNNDDGKERNKNECSIFNESLCKFIIPKHIMEREKNQRLVKYLKGKSVDLELLWYNYLEAYIFWLNTEMEIKKNTSELSGKITNILHIERPLGSNDGGKENQGSLNSIEDSQKRMCVAVAPVSNCEEGNIMSKIQSYL